MPLKPKITIAMSEYSGLLAGCKTALASLIEAKLDGPLDFWYTCEVLKDAIERVEGKEALAEFLANAEAEALAFEHTARELKALQL